MNFFNKFLELGYEHIVSFSALDHILFILVLMAAYQPKNWLKLLILISLFTIGHTSSLVFSALNWIDVNKSIIEFLIPLTIVLTALLNLTKAGQNARGKSKHWIALLFGIIHGFGFSNYFGMLIAATDSYWEALFPFTLGVELGQIVVALSILLLMFIFQTMLRLKLRDWNLFVSGAAFGIAVLMCIENWPG